MKKLVSLTLIMLLLAALVFPSALAQESSFRQNGMNGMGSGQNANPPVPENPSNKNADGSAIDNSNKNNSNVEPVNVEEVKAVIAKLTDKKIADELQSLLSAYEKALSGKDSQALQKAATALKKALAAARVLLNNAEAKPTNTPVAKPEETGKPPVETSRPVDVPKQTTHDNAAPEASLPPVNAPNVPNGDVPAPTGNGQPLPAKDLNDSDAGKDRRTQKADAQPVDAAYGKFLDIDKMEKNIKELDNSDTKKALNELLKAYTDALDKGDKSKIQEALQALLDAIREAQPKLDDGMNPDRQTPNAIFRGYLDVDKVAKAIENLTDESAGAFYQKLNLQNLLDAYENALSEDDEDALEEAFETLVEALEAVGIDIGVLR